MADTPLFQVGGLASGLDTQSIIDGLTKIEQQPLDTLRTQQTDFKTQVSVIGQLVGKIQTLQQAAKALSTNGAVGIKATTVNTDFTATPELADAGGQLPGLGAVAGDRGATAHGRVHARRERHHHGQGRHAAR